VLQPPIFGNFTNYRDILRPYEIGIGAYSKVNIKYINPFLRKKEKLGLYFFSVRGMIYWFLYFYFELL
jgi:hypothetical protein